MQKDHDLLVELMHKGADPEALLRTALGLLQVSINDNKHLQVRYEALKSNTSSWEVMENRQ